MIEWLVRFIIRNRDSMGENILGLFNILWGLWLINPSWDTFSLPSYHAFSLVGPELYWGISILLFGFLLTYFANGKSFTMRRILMLVNMTLWGFVSVTMALSSIETASVVAYATFGLFSFWHYLRISILSVFRER